MNIDETKCCFYYDEYEDRKRKEKKFCKCHYDYCANNGNCYYRTLIRSLRQINALEESVKELKSHNEDMKNYTNTLLENNKLTSELMNIKIKDLEEANSKLLEDVRIKDITIDKYVDAGYKLPTVVWDGPEDDFLK